MMMPKETLSESSLSALLKHVRLLAMDVDGVLTDGKIVYDSSGSEHKAFHALDGLGLVLMHRADIRTVWITGRSHDGVVRRAKELKVEPLFQNVRDKGTILRGYCDLTGIERHEVAYIGDDLNDLPAFAVVGVKIAVANAVEELRQAAHWVTTSSGGKGAVREVCMGILDAKEWRDRVVQEYLESLSEPGDPLSTPASN